MESQFNNELIASLRARHKDALKHLQQARKDGDRAQAKAWATVFKRISMLRMRAGDDGRRDAYMASLGLTVIRIPAAEVLADPEGVADGLYRLCESAAGPSTNQPGG